VTQEITNTKQESLDPLVLILPTLSRPTNSQAINKGGRDRVQGKLASQQAFMSRTAQQSVTQTMCVICELLTEEPEGGCDMIPFETFKELYTQHAQ